MRRRINIVELVLLIMAGTIAFVLCTYFVGMIFNPTNEANIQLRIKIVDLINFIAGGVMGIVASVLSVNTKP